MNHPITVHPFTIPIRLGALAFEISGFGIAVLLAFVIAQVVSEHELRRRGYDFEARHVADVLFAAVVGTLLGGKLYYVAFIKDDRISVLSVAQFIAIAIFVAGLLIMRARGAPAARPATDAVSAPRFA